MIGWKRDRSLTEVREGRGPGGVPYASKPFLVRRDQMGYRLVVTGGGPSGVDSGWQVSNGGTGGRGSAATKRPGGIQDGVRIRQRQKTGEFFPDHETVGIYIDVGTQIYGEVQLGSILSSVWGYCVLERIGHRQRFNWCLILKARRFGGGTVGALQTSVWEGFPESQWWSVGCSLSN